MLRNEEFARQSNAELVATMLDNIIAPNTKLNYMEKVMHFAEDMQYVHPEYIEDGDENWNAIGYTAEGTSALIAFYAHVSKK